MQTVTSLTREDTMYYGNMPVLLYKIGYPSFTTTCSPVSAQMINAYYIHAAKTAEAYCRKVLYPQAVKSAEGLQPGRHFNGYTVDVVYKITYNSGCITSLYVDTYSYLGGAHGETKRISNTWDFKSGKQISLNRIYPFTPAFLYSLQRWIEEQITERLNADSGSYFDNYHALLRNSFNPNSFYLTPDSLVIYYQQYDIAPYATGLPEFSIPTDTFPMELLFIVG